MNVPPVPIQRRSRIPTALVSAAATVVLAFGCGPSNQYQAPPPSDVTVIHPIRKSVMTYLEYQGETRPVETVEIRARVKGFLTERNFTSGEEVKEGQLLFVIEEKPFEILVKESQAKLAVAQSNLNKAQSSKAREISTAQLALDKASLLLANVEESRQHSLASRNAATQQDIDRAEASQRKSEAQVESDEASLEQAKADYDVNILAAKASVAEAQSSLEDAKNNLSYCRVVAPFNGRISRNLVDVGNLVGDGQTTLLAVLLKEDPIYAYVSVSESDVLRFRKMVAEGRRPDYRTEAVPLELGMSDEKGFPHTGRLDYSDPGVDSSTGTVQARGIFPNPDRKIVPGSFVNVRVPFENKEDALLVPESALGSDQTGRFLLVVGPKDIVEQRKVETGSQVDDMRIIESGLEPNDRVVVNGLQRCRPGQPVKPKMKGEDTDSLPSKTAEKAPGTPAESSASEKS